MSWVPPLNLQLVATSDGESFKTMSAGFTGLPLGKHPGAFGAVRKYHRHEGVDLYVPSDTWVYAVERGEVVAILPFTGRAAMSPWWRDTMCVMVEGASGVVVYGEINPHPRIEVGKIVFAQTAIGWVEEVLTVDKGRPTSMLHLELHAYGSRSCPDWSVDGPKPTQLYNPTNFLLPLSL